MDDNDSDMSDSGDRKLYAALRFYVDNTQVKFLPVERIQSFVPGNKCFPYDANVENGTDAEGNKKFEPAVILEISKDKELLQNKVKRWPKPNKRLSVVVHELAQKAAKIKTKVLAQAKGKGKATKKKTISAVQPSNKDVVPPVTELLDTMKDQINGLEKGFLCDDHSTDDLIEIDKDKLIQNLQRQIESLKNSSEKATGSSPQENPRICWDVTDDRSLLCTPSVRSSLTKSIDTETPSSAQYSRTHPVHPFSFVSEGISGASNASIRKYNKNSSGSSVLSKQFSNLSTLKGSRSHNTELESLPSTSGLQKIYSKNSDSTIKKKKKVSLQERALVEKRRSECNKNKSEETPKKKVKYVKKLKEVLYDTDEYDASDCEVKRPRLTTWKVEQADGHTKTMFHIHFGVSVPYKAWKTTKKASTAYKFLRELIPHVWETELFIRLAVQIKRTHDSHDRVHVDPKKFEALKRAYTQYLLERKIISMASSPKKRATEVKKFGRIIGTLIAQERQKYFSVSPEDREEMLKTKCYEKDNDLSEDDNEQNVEENEENNGNEDDSGEDDREYDNDNNEDLDISNDFEEYDD